MLVSFYYYAWVSLGLTALICCVLTDDYEALKEQRKCAAFNDLTIFSGFLVFINFISQLVVLSIGGPIIVIVIGILKEVALTYYDFAYLDSTQFTTTFIAGLAISLVGTGLWAKTKGKESFQAKQRDTTLIDYAKAKKTQ